jgi:PGF-pre-PGF domain-containing protein
MESSSGNEVTGNVLNSNTYSGILLIKSSWNTISGTTANFNQNGMQLVTDSNYNVITGNNADRNSQYGLYLQANSSWNRIFENAFSANSRHGILVYMSPYNEITSNNISSNRINGLYLFFSPGSWISYNKACNNTNYDVYCNSSLGNAGTENVFSKVKGCYDGWPVLWTDYSDCVVVASETASLETLDEGVPGVFYFNGWNVLIDNINVEVNDSMEDVSITVSKLREKPAYAIADLPGERDYAFLNITAANMSMGNVVNVTINFAVEKSWLSDNAINQSTVKMHRYDGGSWTPLQTDIIGEDWWYVYYSAVTSHLTDFAISGDRMTGAQTGVASGSAPGFAATPLVMAVAAAMLFAFITMHGRKKKKI